MMRVIEPSAEILILQDHKHYQVDVTKLQNGTAITCPLDKTMKIGIDENGKVCLAKKSWFKPF